MPSVRYLVAIVLTAILSSASAPALAQTTSAAKPKPKPGTTATGRGRGTAKAPTPAEMKAKLKDPSALKEVAPAEFRVRFDTTAGPFVVLVHRAWSPKGADRFYNLVKYGYYDDCRFFRVMTGFMAQFGINGDPALQEPWREANFPDDPPNQSNRRGTISFANRGPDSRTTQLFINFVNNANLDRMGFTPFGEVVSGMAAVDKINAEYGERPDQGAIQQFGNAYLSQMFPKLDYIRTARIVRAPAPVKKPATGRGRGSH